MGRYSTVQAFADTNPNMRKVTYEQAAGVAPDSTSSTTASKKSVRPEKVENPYGSTAGAGSGEFHVYRHARSREMSRMQQLDEDEAERRAENEFRGKIERDRQTELKKTDQRRKKRQREKEAKSRKKVMKLNGLILIDETNGDDKEGGSNDEFEYTPICASQEQTTTNGSSSTDDSTQKRDEAEIP